MRRWGRRRGEDTRCHTVDTVGIQNWYYISAVWKESGIMMWDSRKEP